MVRPVGHGETKSTQAPVEMSEPKTEPGSEMESVLLLMQGQMAQGHTIRMMMEAASSGAGATLYETSKDPRCRRQHDLSHASI